MVSILFICFGAGVFLFFLKGIIFKLKKDVREVEMHDQFKILITLLHNKQEYLKVSSHSSNRMLKMHLTHAGGTTIFILFQAHGLLSIEWEEEYLKQKKHNRKWYYSEFVNQESIYTQINKDVDFCIQTNTCINGNQLCSFEKSAIVLTESNKVDIGDLFSIAWQYTKQMTVFQNLSEEGIFEVLTFNCVNILQVAKEFEPINVAELEDALISLWIFYLDENELIAPIKDLSECINYRIKMYGMYSKVRKDVSKHTYCILYKLFYMFPLCQKLNMEMYSHVPSIFVKTVFNMCEELQHETRSYFSERS
jgi:hypothetical protein